MVNENELLLRLVISVAAGMIIGYERKNRSKEAGIRTHVIVCIGSCLIMIVSKYGFIDVLGTIYPSVDPTRIAAQIVSGVGFLGAGMILVRKQTISGLTTAAGIWATSGVGMAIGGGMYTLGLVCALLIVAIQIVFHLKITHPAAAGIHNIKVILKNKNSVPLIKAELDKYSIQVISFKVDKESNEIVTVEIDSIFPSGFNSMNLMQLVEQHDSIISIALNE